MYKLYKLEKGRSDKMNNTISERWKKEKKAVLSL